MENDTAGKRKVKFKYLRGVGVARLFQPRRFRNKASGAREESRLQIKALCERAERAVR